MKPTKLIPSIVLATLLCGVLAQAQQFSVPDRVAALKASIADSKATLRQYQWISTTVVSLNGDVKSTKQEQCFYGADGTLQKIELDQSQSEAPRGPFRRMIAKQKKEELTDYMKSAVALVKSYVPPSQKKIQAAVDSGNMAVRLEQPGRRARLTFSNYQLPGDSYAMEVNLVNNTPLGLQVSTYLSDPNDIVTLSVTMGQFPDGTIFPADIILNAVNKGVVVTVHNGGYRRNN